MTVFLRSIFEACTLRAKFWTLRARFAYLGFRLKRRTGVNAKVSMARAEAAADRARRRALLIDPMDPDTAERVAREAFKRAL